jgi:hypothetical protein
MLPSDDSSDKLLAECHGIGFSRSSLVEIQDGQPVVTIVLPHIVKVTLRRGIASERPALLALMGLVLVAISAWALVLVLQLLLQGEHPPKFVLLPVTLAPFGGMLIHLALRSRTYLLIETRDDTRKLPFDSSVTKPEIEGFLNQLRPNLQCPLSNDIV